MTVLATHPATEELARFIEGTLEDPARAEVVDHIADCDDCRITVVDVTAFGELEVKSLPVVRRWWVGTAAAAAVAVMIGGAFFARERQYSLAPVIESYAQQSNRPVDARLSGFPHVVRKSRPRGGSESADYAALQMRAKAGEVLQRSGDDPRMQHAKGVAGLLAAEVGLAEGDLDDADRQTLVKQRADAVAMLQSAAERSQNNVTYQSDLAAALIATGGTANLTRAVEVCDRALQIKRDSAEAIFNRAEALELIAQTSQDPIDATKAIDAYKHYLVVDSTSPWAGEARERVRQLTPDSEPQ
jgi:tetratricopeptide (TPR) repeat protein